MTGTRYNGSLEGGYPFTFAGGWTFEPQAQLIYQRMNIVDQFDADELPVSLGRHTFEIMRMGARLTRSTGEKNLFTPYLKVNLLQGIATSGYTNVADTNFALGTYGTNMQMGAGGTFTLNRLLSIYADGAWQQQVGASGFKGWAYNAGLRLAF